jgi:acyl dehydratase
VHFCWGIGDDNPLWLDPNYARASIVGAVTAPGTFLFSIDSMAVFPGLVGWTALGLSQECRWYKRLFEGDELSAQVEYQSCDLVRRREGRSMLVQTSKGSFTNKSGELVGVISAKTGRMDPNDPQGATYEPRNHHYSPDEINEIYRGVVTEEIRGSTPRLWNEVNVGDELGPMTKGPLSLVDMLCWYAGGGLHGRRANRILAKELFNNPDHWVKSADTGVSEHVGGGHLDGRSAEAKGMPGPYDNLNQRTSWLGHLVTDWMGDAGFLKGLNCQLRRPNVFGDTQFLSGVVRDKFVDEDGDSVVSLTLEGINQIGERTTTGSAVVQLPLL